VSALGQTAIHFLQ